MKKRINFFLLIIALLFVTLCSCEEENELRILNVGDYINQDIVEAFSEEYNCKIVYKECASNEEIYHTLLNERFDICVVSDYMIDRMRKEDKIIPLDQSRLTNIDYSSYFEDARTLLESSTDGCADFKDYFVPYFWGNVGIIYNTECEDYVKTNGLKAIYEPSSLYKKGMYNSARDALCICLACYGMNINSANYNELKYASDMIIRGNFDVFGEDNLKSMVQQGLLDMALVYSGDYMDLKYLCENDGEDINFSYYAPSNTNIWFDGMVITKNASNVDLAYEFINYFQDLDNIYLNSEEIGYCPIVESVYNLLIEDEFYEPDIFYPYKEGMKMYKYVSDWQYTLLNDLLDRSKQ